MIESIAEACARADTGASSQSNVLTFPNVSRPTTPPAATARPTRAAVIQLPEQPCASSLLPQEFLANHSFRLHYQPQVDLATGAIKGYEALLRVRDAKGQACNTATVVAAAEQQGFIGQIGTLVLNHACQEFAELRRQGLAPGRLAVNLSPLELRNPSYVESVVRALAQAGLNYTDLELEITENWSLDDSSLHLEQLRDLADLGVLLAVDDFGAGHAAWAHVLKLPISTLKIDRSLISNLVHDPRAGVVVRSISNVCAELGLAVVAEGVCSGHQIPLIRELGCDLGQGFGLFRPMAGTQLSRLKPLTFAC